MAVEIDNRTSQHLDEDALAALVDGVLEDQGATDAEVAIIFVDPDAMRALNREYRGRDEVTDVLAFPIDERDELPTGMPRLLGDVVICLERCAEQAAEQGHTPGAELLVLSVHGVLHLLGYDHETDDGVMLAVQDTLLTGLGEVAWPR
jgi:probable rRNA maturation factor